MSRILESILQPVGFVWVLLLLWSLRSVFRGEGKSGGVCLCLAAILFVGGSTPLPARWMGNLERPYDGKAWEKVDAADAVVMLGGTHDFSRRSPLPFNLGDTSDRIFSALELIRLGKAKHLVLGGAGYETPKGIRPDSELLEHWMRLWRLPTGEIHLLGACRDTLDEAERTLILARRYQWKRVFLVTSASHLRRAEAVFNRVGIETVPVGCDFIGLDALEAGNQWQIVPTLRSLEITRHWLHETLGWWYYKLKGKI